jgi:hypothetical protein
MAVGNSCQLGLFEDYEPGINWEVGYQERDGQLIGIFLTQPNSGGVDWWIDLDDFMEPPITLAPQTGLPPAQPKLRVLPQRTDETVTGDGSTD